MPNRLARLFALAVRPEQEPTDVLLKVCPRCEAVGSKHDISCQKCAKRAERIERAIRAQEIAGRREKGEPISEKEREFLKRNESLLDLVVSRKDLEFLGQAPFGLPERPIAVRPTFKNRLRFFLDRMLEEGRGATTTHAAARLLKFDEKRDFVDFATDHGVRPLMSADWAQLYAAWDTKDVIRLFNERMAERSARTATETEPGKILGSLEASTALGMGGTKSFVDFAHANGIRPAREFGGRPEQMVWRSEDVESLRRLWELETDIGQLEEAEERLARELIHVQKPPMKYPQMLRMRELDRDMATIRSSLAKARQLRERERTLVRELAARREQERAKEKKASARRLARLLAVAIPIMRIQESNPGRD
jgi:hypothetical protein